MTHGEVNSDQKLLTELKETIKKLPLNERKQAAVLYTLFEEIIAQKTAEDAANDACYKTYSEAINNITTSMDQIIEGKRQVTDDEIAYWKTNVEADFAPAPEANTGAPIKSFWRKFIENSKMYHGEQDLPLLEHLTHVEISDDTDAADKSLSTTTLALTFSANEWFTNPTLTVKLTTKDGELLKSEGTPIQWTNNVTVKKTTKTQKNKRNGQTRTITKEKQLKSFFEIFGNYTAEDADEKDDKGEDDEEASMNIWELSGLLEEFNDSIPYALEYYLGIVDEDDEEEGDDEEDEEESSSDDDKGGDKDGSDDDRPRFKGKKGDKKADKKDDKDSKKASRKQSEHEKKKEGDAAGANPAQNPECKQQ